MSAHQKGRGTEFQDLIRISITPAAFDAIAGTLQLGSVGDARKLNTNGERLIWLEAAPLTV
jgi:hypothetical protein